MTPPQQRGGGRNRDQGRGRGRTSGREAPGAKGPHAGKGARRGAGRGRPTKPVGPDAGPPRTPRPAKRRKAPADVPQSDVHNPDGVRLQKLLASAGLGSRRACELLISQGRVEVDGQIVLELGTRVDPATQRIHVDGSRVILDDTKVYLAFNKPLGVVSTMSDDLGRASIADYLPPRNERLFHVGRLDADTEGLLLLTNDGDLAHRLQHPAYEVPKTYIAQVPGPVPRDLGKQLRAGVTLEDGVVTVDSFRLVDSLPGRAIVELVLHEGKKHVVRRLLAEVGHPVQSLARLQVGPILLGQLRPGRTRVLTAEEVGALYRAAGL